MRRLFLITLVSVLLGCGPSSAQMAPTRSGAATALAPATITSPAGVRAPGNALGTIQLNLGTGISSSGLGAITPCAVNGIGASATTQPVDPTGVPAETTSIPFGVSATTPGVCASPPPPSSPNVITGSEFGDGAISLDATEAGGTGLSPLIAVPDPVPDTDLSAQPQQ
jgi:hypothetical protein